MKTNHLSTLHLLNAFGLVAITLAGGSRLLAADFGASDLRCEYARDPNAIAVEAPRLSWVVEAGGTRRGAMQSAYRVLVASSLDGLKKDLGNLWDSGKVSSDQSLHVVYGGRGLVSAQACFWKVKLWDERDEASEWSKPAKWTVGLLKPSDWKAQWITYEPAGSVEDATSAAFQKLLRLEGQKWFWASGAKPGNQAPGKVCFRRIVEVPAGRTLSKAVFLMTADDGFQLFVNGHLAGQGSSWKTLVSTEVGGRLQTGANAIGIEAANGGNDPGPAGVAGRLVLQFTTGDPVVVPVDSSWQTSRESRDRWSWVDFDASAWQPASEVATFGDQPWGKIDVDVVNIDPAPFFRKSFTIPKPVRRATIFASALGVYELRLNGNAVDTDVLSPGWSDYSKRVYYFGYDVTRQLKRGENALGIILGDGWYAGYLAFTGKRHYYGSQTKAIAQLHVEYEDGSVEILGTDDSWKTTTGPVREGDLLMGCVYDASKEMPGWDSVGFADTNWQRARVDTSVKANLQAHPSAPIRRIESVSARKLTEPRPGVYVFDLGQNIVGWVRLKARGDAGQKVVVRHAEMLNPDGTIYTANLRAAKATDTYYLAAGPKRVYEPYFTFHGFQYVEVTGLKYKPSPDDVAGVVVHSDLPRAGWFECSEPLVNKLTLNSLWGQKGNFLDVPTDCPQRDERAGWTGDAQVFMKTACFNMDAPGFYTKWLVDLCQDSQRADGAFGDVAPHVSIVSHGNTGWSDAGPVCNWRMYEMYNDTRVLEQHYGALVRHMEYLAKTSKGMIRGTGSYGDWLRLAGPQHSEAIGTAYYYYAARSMSDIAGVLGKKEQSDEYRELAAQIRSVFVKTFIKPDGQIIDGKKETGQTFHALAFGLDLVPEELRSKVAAQFVASIAGQDNHLATGFLGTPFVLFALQKAGQPELAYRLVLNKTYPSWLQQVIWGSTTMWERWDGWRPEKGFQDPGMNSFNHYWLGCVSEWLFTQAAGIDTEGPGFKHIIIRPEIVDPSHGFDWVNATYASIRGKITSSWKLNGDQFTLDVAIPANTTATVYLPAKPGSRVLEGGQAIERVRGVKFLRQEGDRALLEIGSGKYRFESRR